MSEPAPPGALLAQGRSADVYDIGGGRVLRRRRIGDVGAHEVEAMRLAAAARFPVPAVHSVAGTDMVLDRVDGDDLLGEVTRRPWRAARIGRLLGELQLQLRSVSIDDAEPGTLEALEPVEALVHGDFHPGNVLMSGGEPSVIDWEGAFVGPSDADAVTFWLLASVADVDDVPALVRPIVGAVRSRIVSAFVEVAGRPRPETVDLVCDLRLVDPNMRAAERERIARFRRTHGTERSSGGDSTERP